MQIVHEALWGTPCTHRGQQGRKPDSNSVSNLSLIPQSVEMSLKKALAIRYSRARCYRYYYINIVKLLKDNVLFFTTASMPLQLHRISLLETGYLLD